MAIQIIEASTETGSLNLKAAATDVLFHLTSLRAAAQIIATDQFHLKPADGSEYEETISKGKYYLSTARTMTSSYVYKTDYGYYAVLKLNGRKLNERYAAKPVDYWQNKGGEFQNFEAEDRILSDSPVIKKATSYITAIYAQGISSEDLEKYKKIISNPAFHGSEDDIPTHLKYFYRDTLKTLKQQLQMKKLCVKAGIPFLVFDSAAALRNSKASEGRNYPLSYYTDLIVKVPEEKTPPSAYDFMRTHKTGSLVGLLALYAMRLPESATGDSAEAGDTRSAIVKKHAASGNFRAIEYMYDRLYDWARNDYYRKDVLTGVKNDMHNAKSDPYGRPTKERENLDNLMTILRKHKWTVEQFLDYLAKKWYPQYSK